MRNAFEWAFDALTSINWLEVIMALAPLASVVTAVIAFLALKNWQRQDKAKRQAEFLDAMIEAVHAYIAEMSKPITVLQMAKIGMESHAPTWASDDEADNAVIRCNCLHSEGRGTLRKAPAGCAGDRAAIGN